MLSRQFCNKFGGQFRWGQINCKNVCGDPYLRSDFGSEIGVNLQFKVGGQFAYEFGVQICNKFGGLEVRSEPIVGWF